MCVGGGGIGGVGMRGVVVTASYSLDMQPMIHGQMFARYDRERGEVNKQSRRQQLFSRESDGYWSLVKLPVLHPTWVQATWPSGVTFQGLFIPRHTQTHTLVGFPIMYP